MASTEAGTSNGTNGLVSLQNQLLCDVTDDHLYHIALSSGNDDLPALFGDVKFVCFGGQSSRMEKFAEFVAMELAIGGDGHRRNYAGNTDRYAVYKAGPVLSVSHGIGIPSLSIIFQEIAKLVHYAKCSDVTFFRIGTCGGIGLEPGSVVVSQKVLNGSMESVYRTFVLGKTVDRPAVVDTDLVDRLYGCRDSTDPFTTVKGTTLCADDFYEGQGRTDGAFCEHDNEAKLAWLREINKDGGVTNMEMESLGFVAMCHRANIKGAVCCVTLLDRLKGDGLTTDIKLLKQWQTYPQILVARYIKRQLNV